jgi:hypothetical protein
VLYVEVHLPGHFVGRYSGLIRDTPLDNAALYLPFGDAPGMTQKLFQLHLSNLSGSGHNRTAPNMLHYLRRPTVTAVGMVVAGMQGRVNVQVSYLTGSGRRIRLPR